MSKNSQIQLCCTKYSKIMVDCMIQSKHPCESHHGGERPGACIACFFHSEVGAESFDFSSANAYYGSDRVTVSPNNCCVHIGVTQNVNHEKIRVSVSLHFSVNRPQQVRRVFNISFVSPRPVPPPRPSPCFTMTYVVIFLPLPLNTGLSGVSSQKEVDGEWQEEEGTDNVNTPV